MGISGGCLYPAGIDTGIWHYLCFKKTPCSTVEISQVFGLSLYQARYYLLKLNQEKKVFRLLSGRGRPALWQGVENKK